MRFILPCLMILCVSQAALVHADEYIVPPAGATLLNISAEEQIETDQDLLQANLRLEKRNEDSAKLQSEVNDMMKKALLDIKKFKDVEVSTSQYHVYENRYDLEKYWQGSQGIVLKSTNAAQILELSGILQDQGFLMNSLNYSVSPQKYNDVREGLLEAALHKLTVRAARVGAIIDKPRVTLLEVNVDADSPRYDRPVMMRAEMDMAKSKGGMVAPSAEAGKEQISMSVSARVLLREKN